MLIKYRRFRKLVEQTCGYDKAINIAKITILAYTLLRIISNNKKYFTEAIANEHNVIAFLRETKESINEKDNVSVWDETGGY